MEKLPVNKKIILFDGVCNLCDATVQFIIKKDKNDVFRFVQLQSELGKEIISYIGVDTSKTDSIILYEPGKAYYYKAEAAINIAKELGGVYTAMAIFSLLPKKITNSVYDYVAKNRYKWYGKKNECMIPTPEMKAKFL
ncbi:thiol-disulfide oxidoreductase DCC family protein [Flavobacterium sp. MK4S-17]|uniref:thiol-disulfide oxidoreductase DCC family protein n=1 Tax=Flavobacterium sp. MK4S-17 TaxID=2543737 RepID=UPI00135B08A9|nr:DCC1-like thiol-disulfide oxidoreductase family protein [Flavobacterium sp. MK4S-17]